MLSRKNILRLFINTLIGAILIFVWLNLVDINLILAELKKVNLLYISPFFLFFLLSGALRGLRLSLLLQKYQKIPVKNLVSLTYLGQLLSFMIPLRIGEVAKGVYLSTTFNIPTAKSVVWIFLDRFIDFWAVLLLALILLIFIPTNLPQNLIPILIFLIGILTLAVSFVIFTPKLAKSLINILSHIFVLPVLKKYFGKISEFLVDSAAFLNQGKTTLWAIMVTILALISDAISWYILFYAVFIITSGVQVNFLPIFLGSLLSMLTYLIPAAPGYVGSAEASGLAVFNLGLGLDNTLTSVTVLIFHAVTLISILVSGIVGLYFLKFNLSLVWQKLKR